MTYRGICPGCEKVSQLKIISFDSIAADLATSKITVAIGIKCFECGEEASLIKAFSLSSLFNLKEAKP